ncbi:13396_t:CDS:2, partial [Gigaspora rosea]
LTIVEASGIVRSRSLNFPLNIILIGFYSNNAIQELSLPEFENGDIIVLNDIVRFNDIDPNNIPAFSIMLNMTA